MNNPVLEAIHARRSIRAYKPEQITEEHLKAVLDAGEASPSARNLQPWHFTVVQDQALIQRINEAFRVEMLKGCPEEECARFEDPAYSVFYHAPTVIFYSVPQAEANRYCETDTGMAIQTMALAALSVGLGTVILGMPRLAFQGAEGDDLRRVLQFPAGNDFILAMSVGYPAGTKDAHPVLPGRITIIR